MHRRNGPRLIAVRARTNAGRGRREAHSPNHVRFWSDDHLARIRQRRQRPAGLRTQAIQALYRAALPKEGILVEEIEKTRRWPYGGAGIHASSPQWTHCRFAFFAVIAHHVGVKRAKRPQKTTAPKKKIAATKKPAAKRKIAAANTSTGTKKPAAKKPARRADLGAPIDGFFAKQPPDLRTILETLRELVDVAAPDAEASIKWGVPFYTLGGVTMCALAGFKGHVNLILAGPPEIYPDPAGLLEGDGKTGRHLKLRTLDELPRDAVRDWLRTAAEHARRAGE
jgi:hypothetical protein